MNLLQGVWVLVIESLQFLTPRGGSQVLEIRQIPDVVWDEACEFVRLKKSATNCTYTSFGVKFKVHHIKYTLHSTLYSSPYIHESSPRDECLW